MRSFHVIVTLQFCYDLDFWQYYIGGSKHGKKRRVAIMPVTCTAAEKGHLDCTSVCCSNEMEAYIDQPIKACRVGIFYRTII